MDLQSLIDKNLWIAISETYNAENYTHAILDAINFLSDSIREKSGLDGDGSALIGKALGGENPRLKVNKLQTQSEKDIQKGTEFLLRGLYLGIRNPRSHEQIKDDKQTTDKIIIFIDYILCSIKQSSPPFTIHSFINNVLDEHFVKSNEYVELLVSEIPQGKLYDVLIELHRVSTRGKRENSILIMRTIYNKLDEDLANNFISFLSEELRLTDDFFAYILPFQVIKPKDWEKIHRIARLRIENIVSKSLEEGRCHSNGETIDGAGALATWARDYFLWFSNKGKLISIFSKKLTGQYEDQMYVFSFFLDILPNLFSYESLSEKCIQNICIAAKEEQDFVSGGLRTMLKQHYYKFPDDWQKTVIEFFPELAELDNSDEIPF